MFGVSHKNTWVSCPTNMSVPPTQYGRSLGSSCAFLREPLSVERILFLWHKSVVESVQNDQRKVHHGPRHAHVIKSCRHCAWWGDLKSHQNHPACCNWFPTGPVVQAISSGTLSALSSTSFHEWAHGAGLVRGGAHSLCHRGHQELSVIHQLQLP
ncbi:hypothetical protein BJV77DRAFT_685484 [Russula vinacea]|nr:hypothetical protein BJV77DRAFT_685484 [Russula vinacea]